MPCRGFAVGVQVHDGNVGVKPLDSGLLLFCEEEGPQESCIDGFPGGEGLEAFFQLVKALAQEEMHGLLDSGVFLQRAIQGFQKLLSHLRSNLTGFADSRKDDVGHSFNMVLIENLHGKASANDLVGQACE